MQQVLKKIWHDNSSVFVTLATITILFYPFGFVHETGHYMIGVLQDSECVLIIDWSLGINCSPAPQNTMLYFAMGGIFGMSFGLILFLSKRIRDNRPVFIGISTISFDHFLKVIMETFAHDAYLNNGFVTALIGIISIVFMFALLGYLGVLTKDKSQTCH